VEEVGAGVEVVGAGVEVVGAGVDESIGDAIMDLFYSHSMDVLDYSDDECVAVWGWNINNRESRSRCFPSPL